ncbi:MAG TPA: tetratricopeptide repeat protein [Terriglobales bacterium]
MEEKPQPRRHDAQGEPGPPGVRTPIQGESSSGEIPAPRANSSLPEGATLVDLPPPLAADATMVDLGPLPPRPAPPISSRPSYSGLFVSAAILRPGDVLGNRYEILQLLGEGGMGAVYKAKDRELDRFLALKLIRPELAGNSAILARFKQELLLAHQVTHRNVIRIYDLAEADGLKFITMEYIEGVDLRRLLLDHGKFPPAEAVAIIRQVCLALEAAHTVGVIHRDLKPQNIMRDAQGRILVMDFGLARSVGSDGMTQTGALVGTMEYMSPEQAMGDTLDQRSDLFALGLIFFELLTGKMPYKAETALASLLKRSRERAIPAVELEPSIPRGVSDIVAKCLERDLAQRYKNVQEILNDLDAWEGKRRVAASSPMVWLHRASELPWKWIGVAALAVAVAGGGWELKQNFSSNPASAVHGPLTSLAILPFRNASGDPSLDWLGSSVAEMLTTDVGQSASLRTVSPDRLHQVLKDLHIDPNLQLDPQMVRQLGEFSNAQTIVWGQYAKIGDQIRMDVTLQDLKQQRTSTFKAEAPSEKELLAAVDRLAQSIRENLALPPEVVKELEAQAFRPSSQSVEALRDYDAGLALVRQGNNLEAQKRFEAATLADPQFALALSRLAQTYASLGYDNEAERYSRRAVELSQQLPAAEKYLIEANNARIQNDTARAIAAYESMAKVSPDDPDLQFTLAGLYESDNDFDKAKQHYAKALEQDPKYVDALLASGRVDIKSGDPQSGLDYLNRALSLAVQLDNQEEKAAILHAIGVAYKLLDRPQDALKNYQDSLAIKRQIGDKRGIAVSLNESAQVETTLGKPEAALADYQEALRIRREIGDRRGEADTLMDLGTLYDDRGQTDQALDLYKQALQIQRDLGIEQRQATSLNNIGSAYLAKGQYEDALAYYQQALTLQEKLKLSDDQALTVKNLAVTTAKLGQFDQALTQYLKALDLYRANNDTQGAAEDAYDMGSVFEYQGRLGAALKAREDALKTFRDLKDRSFWMAEILSGYGKSLALVGRAGDAQKALEESLGLARQLKNEPLISQALQYQGDSAFYHGDLKSARALHSQALQSATASKNAERILLSRAALARDDVQSGRAAAATVQLRSLSQQADSRGLKYVAVEASIDLGEALLKTRALPQARQELERALTRCDKLGLNALKARAEYLLGMALRMSGNAAAAAEHYRQALSLLQSIQKEAGTDTVLRRADFVEISAEAGKWTLTSKN